MRACTCLFALACSVVVAVCGSGRQPTTAANEASASDVAKGGAASQQDWFTDEAKAAGLDFVHFNGMSGQYYYPEIMGPGVALLDYDNDGDLDVYLVQGQMLGRG